MNSVVGSSVQNIFQWSNIVHHFCMNPELINKVELLMNYGLSWRYKKCQWQIERHTSESLHQRLPEGCSHIVIFRAMMYLNMAIAFKKV